MGANMRLYKSGHFSAAKKGDVIPGTALSGPRPLGSVRRLYVFQFSALIEACSNR